MRVSPSKEQNEYLRAIGAVDGSVPSVPGGTAGAAAPASGSPASSSAGMSLPSGVIVFIVIATLVLLAAMARAEEAVGVGSPVENRLAEVETAAMAEPAAEERPSEADSEVMQTGVVDAELETVEQRPSPAELAASREEMDNVEARVFDLEARVNSLGQESRSQANALWQASTRPVVGLVVVTALLLGLICVGRRTTMDLRRAMTHGAATRQTVYGMAKSKIGVARGARPEASADSRREPTRVAVAATRAPKLVTMGSPELERQLVANASIVLRSLKVHPETPGRSWQVGVVSHKGNVRDQNQDVGVALTVGECDIMVVADGCGGIPHGREAAYLSVASAGMRLIQILGNPPMWRGLPDIQEAIRSAIWAAHHQLALQADDLNIACGDINGGLRCTLIVVVGNRNQLHYGYIGDGGGWLIRTNGAVERFLAPQKSAGTLNVLDASLGPMLAGIPVVGTVERSNGDLAMVGSDGVFDRIPASEIEVFGKDILRACIQRDGDLVAVATQVCDEYASLKDDVGFICDDNLTIGLMATRAKPVLGPGFWSSAPTDEETC